MTKEKKTGPYIGRTGSWTPDLIREALRLVPEDSAYRLMVGLLVGSRTSHGGMANEYPERLTKRDKLVDVCVRDPRLLALIHYRTADAGSLDVQLQELVAISGPGLDGFQLNMAWPPVDRLATFRSRHPEKCLVLQIGKEAIRTADGVSGLMERIGWYADLVDSVLYDPSGGAGMPFDRMEAGTFLWQFTSRFPSLGFAVAGGLGPDPEELEPIRPLLDRYRGLSMDAERRVETADDCLWYLANAFALVSK